MPPAGLARGHPRGLLGLPIRSPKSVGTRALWVFTQPLSDNCRRMAGFERPKWPGTIQLDAEMTAQTVLPATTARTVLRTVPGVTLEGVPKSIVTTTSKPTSDPKPTAISWLNPKGFDGPKAGPNREGTC
jgi:hypothetical protein